MENNTHRKVWINGNIELVIDTYKTDSYRHHITIYNDDKDSNVDFTFDSEKLKDFANFILKYLGDK
jgi:hypothetical protein